MCGRFLTLLTGGSSSLDPLTRQSESGMPRLVLQSESHLRGTLSLWYPFLTLLMDAASSLGPKTRQFESGMLRLTLRLEIFKRGALTMRGQLLSLLMGGTSSQNPVIRRFTSRIHLHTSPPILLRRLSRPDGQTQRVGSETQWAAYSIGSPQIVVQNSIRLLSSSFPSHTLFGRLLFNLKSLSSEPLGPKFSTPRIRNHSLFSDLCVYCIVLIIYWL